MAANDNQRWSDFSVRLGSALILGPIALACLIYGGWGWNLFIGVAMIGLGYEWAGLAGIAKPLLRLLPALMVAVWVCETRAGWGAGLLAVLIMTFIASWFTGRFAASGIPYAGIGGISLLWLRLQPGIGLTDTLFLVLVVWSTDVGAYVVGRIVGGPKLAPQISPGKTRSGAIGGLLAAGLAGGLLAGGGHGFDVYAIPAALVLSVFAQAGDLLESAIKRKLGVKDSGRSIPGHGGLFDRLDGFLTAAPLAAIFALCAHGGLPLWG
jgi:phosphatidate cytidylyltransferase